MIISRIENVDFTSAFGIEMASIATSKGRNACSLGASWGRVAPGQSSIPHRHDESEAFVIVTGKGDVVVDGERQAIEPGMVTFFDPFETHVIDNTGEGELIFVDLYWRENASAGEAASQKDRDRCTGDPVFVFSTPPTPNGDLHLGHLSGPYLGADVFVRFQRMNGVKAWHLTGSDDYQSYVVECARREKRSPAETAAFYSREIKATLELLDVEVDQYTITAEDPAYREGLQRFFSRLVASGAVARRQTGALFDGVTNDYLYEVNVSGHCPNCHAPTGGNICEECGEPNLCAELIDPKSRFSEAMPRYGTADLYCLPLSEFQESVFTHQRSGKTPARLRELTERVFQRKDFQIPITHVSNWGVPPVEETDGDQVIWVWPEMAFGFLHGIQELGKALDQEWVADEPDPDWNIVHFFGYDNSFYHGILYPVLYKLAYPEWEPKIDYNYNEFYLLEGAKFSTSRRHAIWGKEILEPRTVDAIRYYLCLTRGETERTNFDRASFEAEVATTLIGSWQAWLNDIGTRLNERFSGKAPDAGVWLLEHKAFLAALYAKLDTLGVHLSRDGFSLNKAAQCLNELVVDARRFREANRSLADWGDLNDEYRTSVALELAAARLLASCCAPLMPRFSKRLAGALGDEPPMQWPDEVALVPVGQRIELAEAVFFEPIERPSFEAEKRA